MSHESFCCNCESVCTLVLHAFCLATALTWHQQDQIGAYKAKLNMAASIPTAPSCFVCPRELAGMPEDAEHVFHACT